MTAIYFPPESDSSCAEESDDDSIKAFMAQFKPVNKAVLTDGRSVGSHHNVSQQPRRSSDRAALSLSSSSFQREAAAVVSPSASKRRTRPPWNADVYFEPAPTDMVRMKSYEHPRPPRPSTASSVGSASFASGGNANRLRSTAQSQKKPSSSSAGKAGPSKRINRTPISHYSSVI